MLDRVSWWPERMEDSSSPHGKLKDREDKVPATSKTLRCFPWRLTSSREASPPKSFTTFQKSAISWGPSVQYMCLWRALHSETIMSRKEERRVSMCKFVYIHWNRLTGRLNKTPARINFLVVYECLVGNSPLKFVSYHIYQL